MVGSQYECGNRNNRNAFKSIQHSSKQTAEAITAIRDQATNLNEQATKLRSIGQNNELNIHKLRSRLDTIEETRLIARY